MKKKQKNKKRKSRKSKAVKKVVVQKTEIVVEEFKTTKDRLLNVLTMDRKLAN